MSGRFRPLLACSACDSEEHDTTELRVATSGTLDSGRSPGALRHSCCWVRHILDKVPYLEQESWP